jgi:hypothetical protein
LEDYQDSGKIQRLLRAIERKLTLVGARQQDRDAQKSRFAETKALLSRILDDWNSQFDEFMATTEAELHHLQEQQANELAAFDAQVPEELTPQYRKRSSCLIELREKERALAMNQRFVAAQRLKERNDAAEEREGRAQFEKMQSDFLKRRERLVIKHDEQLRVFVDHAESGRRRLIKNRNQLIQGHIKRLSLIDQEFANPDELKGEVSEERKQVIEEVEAAYPIPRMRGASFTTVRQRLRMQNAEPEDTETDAQADDPAEEEHAVEEGVTEVLSVGELSQDDQEEAAITFE